MRWTIVFGIVPLFFAFPSGTSALSDEDSTAELLRNLCGGCCEPKQVLNDGARCKRSRTMVDVFVDPVRTNETGRMFVCVDSATNVTRTEAEDKVDTVTDAQSRDCDLCADTCIQVLPNGTLIVDEIMENQTSSDNVTNSWTVGMNETKVLNGDECGSVLTPLNFWGATMVIFANMIYIFPYLFVVLVYVVIPELRHRAHDGAVIAYNFSQVLTQVILIAMGASILCHVPINPAVLAPAGLSLMFLTISSTLWLFVICFDMTLVITRFRWAPPGEASRKQEGRKFWIYAAWVWGGTFVPTLFACIVEFTLAKDSLIRPKFETLNDGPRVTVILYVTTVPALVCIINSALFCYTTYRMIVMQRETTMATQSSTRNAKKRYFVYLKLYLLMDTPWLTGALGAIFPDLWILKFWRMSQPILMLLVILPQKKLRDALRCKSRGKDAGGVVADQQDASKRRLIPCC